MSEEASKTGPNGFPEIEGLHWVGNKCYDEYGRLFGEARSIEVDKGAKDTAGKPRYSLLPRKGCEAVIAVREFGTAKYHGDSENWRKVPQREWAEACLRHVFKWLDGEEFDPESGLPHLDHAACSLFLAVSIKDSPNTNG